MASATACCPTTPSPSATTAERGKLVTIGKAYSGLTDAEIAEMTGWFEEHTISQFGRYRVVEPTVVVEIAFDVIVRSNRHGSGFACASRASRACGLDKSRRRDRHGRDRDGLYEGLQHGSELLVTAGARTVPPRAG